MIRYIALSSLIIVTLFACFFGCGTVEKPKPSVIYVMCDECGGDGQALYMADHPLVKLGFSQGYHECPMCGGSGILYEDQR